MIFCHRNQQIGLSAIFSFSPCPSFSLSSLNQHPSGGLETIFNGEKEKKLQVEAVARRKGDEDDDDSDDGGDDGGNDSDEDLDAAAPTTTVARVAAVAAALADPDQAHMLFVRGSETVRPGVLVLVNDADWELEGETAYLLQDGDRIVFISTLHGG